MRLLLDIAACCLDIAVFQAAIAYQGTRALPYKSQLAAAVDRYARRRTPTPTLLQRAATGCEPALWALQAEHPTLLIEREPSGELRIKAIAPV